MDLSGRKFLVTRSADDATSLVAGLAGVGAETVVLPCITIEFIDDTATRNLLAQSLKKASSIALTSRRGVEAVARLEAVPRADVLIAAVGEATARAAVAHFGRCDLVAPAGNAASLGCELADLLRSGLHTGPVVVPAAENGRRDLETVLIEAGFTINRIVVYRTVPVSNGVVRMNLAEEGVDTVILASPSAVTGLLNQAVLSPDTTIITIGPTTSEAARSKGLTVSAQAAQPSEEAIIEACNER